jgi:hypothetical protein
MKNKILIAVPILLITFALTPIAQATLRASNGTGGGTWGTGSTWQGGTAPSSTDTVEIKSGDTVTVGATATIAGVLVDNGGTLAVLNKVLTISHGANPYDLDVHGTVDDTESSGLTFGSGATAIIESDGTLLIGKTGSVTSGGTITVNGTVNVNINISSSMTIPTATWGANSLLEFTGETSGSSTISGLNQTFGNFTWNCPSQTASENMLQTSGQIMTVAGNFKLANTGSGALALDNISSGTCTLNIGGSLTIGNTALFAGSHQNKSAISYAINFTGTGIIAITNQSATTGWQDSDTGATGEGKYCIWTVNSGSVMTLGSNWTLGGQEGHPGADTLTVASGGTLNCAGFTISENIASPASTLANTFTLASGGTLGIGSVDATGAITTSGADGNIQVSGTRSFSTGGNYTYNGSGAQVTGNGLPATVNNLTIANTSGVTLSGNLAINGAFGVTYASGTPALAVGSDTLTLNNNAVTITVSGSPIANDANYTIVSASGGAVTGPTGGSLTVNGSGAPVGATGTSISDSTGQLVLSVAGGTATALTVVLPGQTGGIQGVAVSGTPTQQTAGVPFNVTVNAVDSSGFVVSSDSSTVVNFTSSDGAATLPADGSTTLANGTATVSVTLNTAGPQTVTAADQASVLTSYQSSSVQVLGVPILETAPTASTIFYGQALSNSILSGGICTNTAGRHLGGTFTFTSPGTIPPVGTTSYSVTFTPSDTTDYTSISLSVSVTVNPQLVPTLETAPTASTIIYGQALSNSILSGGVCTNATGTNINGTFAFTIPGAVPLSGITNASVTFTAADSVDFSSINFTVPVTVSMGTLILSNAPVASVIYISQALSNSILSGGVCTNLAGVIVPGIFAFTTPGLTPGLGTANQSVTFTATDTNYNSISFNVAVTVTPFTTTTLTTNSSTPWTVPPGVTSIQVEMWGGGGAGGGALNNNTAYGGGGGGGGAYTTTTLSGLIPGNTIAFSVGTGGTGTAGANGNSGNATSFTGATTAAGGSGGVAAATSTGGAGGTGAYSGGAGAAGTTTYGGGGGSGAGTNVVGNSASGATGGAAVAGGGAGATGIGTSGQNGTAGSIPGGGGAGAFEHGTTARAGGTGGNGQIVINNMTGVAAALQVLLPGQTTVTNSGIVSVTGTPTTQTIAVPFSVTINAVDASGYVATGATPTVNFTSSDAAAVLPANGTTTLVNGMATASVTFNTAGTQNLTNTDAASILLPYTSSTVTVQSSSTPRPVITSISLSGANLIVNGSNGAAVTYYLLMSTNVALPLNQWTPVATNTLIGSGSFTMTCTNAVSAGTPQQFYILQVP